MKLQKNPFIYIGLLSVLLSFYAFYGLFIASLNLENARAQIRAPNMSQEFPSEQLSLVLHDASEKPFPFLARMLPAERARYSRASLQSYTPGDFVEVDVHQLYHQLLSIKPSWPYYYSGLVQSSSLSGKVDEQYIRRSMRFGRHERLVVKSLSEVLFYQWSLMTESMQNEMLDHLIIQNDVLLSEIVKISARFAKIYPLCDFIYEKKQVEYAACKDQYWQPLKDA